MAASEKYDVHAYAVVRVKVAGIEAASPVAAKEKAEAGLTSEVLGGICNTQIERLRIAGGEVEHAEYAEEIAYFLVDALAREDETAVIPGSYDPEVGAEAAASLRAALAVLVRTPQHRQHLEVHDPQALAQAERALRWPGMSGLAAPTSSGPELGR